ncbi:MAG: hypothetical protein L6R28_13965 [Planctomycetes bacterium]|nr:hypothetical protein [Planctomycetota bacterium]
MIAEPEAPAICLAPDALTRDRFSNISQVLRRIATESVTERRREPDPAIVVRKVRRTSELEEVHRLTYRAYRERGYCGEQPDGKLVHYPHLENIPETSVFVAYEEGKILGTVSVTLDGPAGLHVDADFKDTVDKVRAENRRLCAPWRIATHSSLRSEKRVVMALLQAVVDEAFDAMGCQTFLCTFNPRHERFYRRIWNMPTIARHEGSDGLENAPAVLMRCDIETIPLEWLNNVGGNGQG